MQDDVLQLTVVGVREWIDRYSKEVRGFTRYRGHGERDRTVDKMRSAGPVFG